MNIHSKLPEILVLREKVEESFGRKLRVHSDFEALRDAIFDKTKKHLSESTLERMWNYSTRKDANISLHTLDLVCSFANLGSWEEFVGRIEEETENESNLFDVENVRSEELVPGDEVIVGWRPNRECRFRFLGSDRFEVLDSRNAKLQAGDTFSCLQFLLHSPLIVSNLADSAGNMRSASYGAGLRNGLTMLRMLKK